MFNMNNLLLVQGYIGGFVCAFAVRRWGHLISLKMAKMSFWALFVVFLLAFNVVDFVYGLDSMPPTYVQVIGIFWFLLFISSSWLMMGVIPLRKKRA